jgi:hypothetical protein
MKFQVFNEFSKAAVLELDLPASSTVLNFKKHLSVEAGRTPSKIELKLASDESLCDREVLGHILNSTKTCWVTYLCYTNDKEKDIHIEYPMVRAKAYIDYHGVLSLTSKTSTYPLVVLRSLYLSPFSDPYAEIHDYVGIVIYGRKGAVVSEKQEFFLFGEKFSPGYLLLRKIHSPDIARLRERSPPVSIYEAAIMSSFKTETIPKDLIIQVFTIQNNNQQIFWDDHSPVFPLWDRYYFPSNPENCDQIKLLFKEFMKLSWKSKRIGSFISIEDFLFYLDPLNLSGLLQDTKDESEFRQLIIAICHLK